MGITFKKEKELQELVRIGLEAYVNFKGYGSIDNAIKNHDLLEKLSVSEGMLRKWRYPPKGRSTEMDTSYIYLLWLMFSAAHKYQGWEEIADYSANEWLEKVIDATSIYIGVVSLENCRELFSTVAESEAFPEFTSEELDDDLAKFFSDVSEAQENLEVTSEESTKLYVIVGAIITILTLPVFYLLTIVEDTSMCGGEKIAFRPAPLNIQQELIFYNTSNSPRTIQEDKMVVVIW